MTQQQHVGTVYASGSSVTLPTHQAGDLIVIAAVRWGVTTVPDLPSGYTSLLTATDTHGRRLGYKIATSSSETSGTWTNATTMVAAVYRYATPRAAATSTTAAPGLTLQQPGASWVWLYHCAWPLYSPSGWITRLNLEASDRRISDSAAALSGWAGGSVTTSFSFALELAPLAEVSSAVAVQRSAAGAVSSALAVQRSQVVASVASAVQVGRQSFSTVSAELPASRSALSLGTWRELVRTPYWLDTVGARSRMISARAELVDAAGAPVAIDTGSGLSWDLPLASAKVTFSGEQREQWSAIMSFTDPWAVPANHLHPLYGMRNLRVRLWWRILAPSGLWMEALLCTVVPEDPDSTDAGTVTTTLKGRDVLGTARGGYGAPLDVSGLTLDLVLAAIFARVAPTVQTRIAPTTVTAPSSCVLGENDPADDWTRYAEAAWPNGVVRSDCDGVVSMGPRPVVSGPVLDWQEGSDCPVSGIKRGLKTSALGNRQTVISTNSESVGVFAMEEDKDPSSPTWVGGPWGVHPLPDIMTDLTTEEACRNIARMHLGKGLHPTEDVEVTIPQRPDLMYQQPVMLARQQLGVGGTYRISSWELDVPVDGADPRPMTVRMMRRSVS